jgi:hypothetical protein
MWSFEMCDFRTGAKLGPVKPSGGGWGRRLSGTPSATSSVFPIAAKENRRLRSPAFYTGWKRVLVRSWNGVARDARIIVDDDLSRDDMMLTLHHVDFRTAMTKRYPFGINSYYETWGSNVRAGVFQVANLSWGSVGVRLVQESVVGPYDMWSLPVVFPLLVAGTHGMKIPNYLLTNTDALLANLSKMDGGPEFDFAPRWSPVNGNLEWVMKTGTDANPLIPGPLINIFMNPSPAGLAHVHKKRDFNEVITGVFTPGAGAEFDMLIYGRGTGDEGDTTSTALDIVQPYKSVTVLAELQSLTMARIAAQRNPTVQWEFDIVADAHRDFGSVELGTTFRLHFKKDLVEPDGHYDVRVVELTGDMTSTMKPKLQPAGGA